MNEKDIKMLSEQEVKDVKNRVKDEEIMLKALDEYIPKEEKEEDTDYDLDEL